ncbi:MAG: hypothetical protein WC934_12160 [Acidithiobacillus sp.]|jgi:hypothetical protein|uniref:hypothetical protein n=1 Tax=Acidithiobacillus sp. TaxID=1872118 RepID=UPI00355D5E4C
MKKVFQTKFGIDGNCTQACIASFLEIDINRLPEKFTPNLWFKELNESLIKFDSYAVMLDAAYGTPKDAYVMAGGKSLRGFGHYVIMKNDKLIHDPFPNGTGLFGKIEDYLLIVPLMPFPVRTERLFYEMSLELEEISRRIKKDHPKYSQKLMSIAVNMDCLTDVSVLKSLSEFELDKDMRSLVDEFIKNWKKVDEKRFVTLEGK